jgi:hypothetical protein
VTEPQYLRDFQHNTRNPRVHVELAPPSGVPLTVVTEAIRLRNEADLEAQRLRDDNARYDDVWAVFDVDDHPNLADAKLLALNEKIELAVSNPCFELWALLHFQDQRAHVQRVPLRAALQGHLPGYKKRLDFRRMHVGYNSAVTRAQELDREAQLHVAPGRNPTTQIYRLTELIRTS